MDIDALEFGLFEPGAVIRTSGGSIGSPTRSVARGSFARRSLPRSARLPTRRRLARLVLDVRTHSVRDLLRRPDMTTADRLARAGFSNQMIESLWRPLFAGIQLDPDLDVSSRRFETILRMLAVGATGVPRHGMGAIPAQLASTLPDDTVRLGAKVADVDGTGVTLDGGERVDARTVVVATEGPTAHRLLGHACPRSQGHDRLRAAGSPPPAPRLRGPCSSSTAIRSGPAKNLAVMSEVQPVLRSAGSSPHRCCDPRARGTRPDRHDRCARPTRPVVRLHDRRLGASPH